jgi:hypothetical protein
MFFRCHPVHDEPVNRYLVETLGVGIACLSPWKSAKSLPLGLRQQFHFMAGQFQGTPVLLAFDLSNEPVSAAKVRKQLEQVESRFQGDVILIRQAVLPYERKRLIEQHVAFVVPGTQIHLPQWGVSLRDVFRKAKTRDRAEISPSAQVLLIHLLNHFKANESIGVHEVASALRYSQMTLRRAIHELGALEAFEVEGSGSGRELRLNMTQSPRQVWQSSLPSMRSPISRTIEVLAVDGGQILRALPLAGMSALAAQTMISEPARQILAIASDAWPSFAKTHSLQIADPDEPEATKIECWRYDPRLLCGGELGGLVDPFSLYLSLCDNEDERIQIALEELMEDRAW